MGDPRATILESLYETWMIASPQPHRWNSSHLAFPDCLLQLFPDTLRPDSAQVIKAWKVRGAAGISGTVQ